MVYTVTQLITEAFYLSGVISEEFEEISGYQITKGLKLLKAAIEFKTAQDRLIPYFKQYDFAGVIGQEKYFIPDLIEVETLTFSIAEVRYPMSYTTRQKYFGTPRANNIDSLPYIFFVEKKLGGADLYMYFFPQQTYAFQLHGKFRLDSDLTLLQDLSLTLDGYYIEYLRYLLAEYICEDYQIQLTGAASKKLDTYENSIFDTSPYDLSMTKDSILQSNTTSPDIYAQVNITTWLPS